MARAEVCRSSLEGVFKAPLSPQALHQRMPPSPSMRRDRPSLAAAGHSFLTRSTPSLPARPSSRESDCSDDGNWGRQQRASIKKGLLRAVSNTSRSSISDESFEESRHKVGKVGKVSSRRTKKARRDSPDGQKVRELRDVLQRDESSGVLKAPRRLPPLEGPRPVLVDRTNTTSLSNDESQVQCSKVHSPQVEAKRSSVNAHKAHASACWEDMIAFLELNKLSGAYALAFSAHGIDDLPSLLSLDDAALSSLLEKCNIDAMDEILLLDAVKTANPFR